MGIEGIDGVEGIQRTESEGEEDAEYETAKRTRAPTVMPAATEGTEPVRI